MPCGKRMLSLAWFCLVLISVGCGVQTPEKQSMSLCSAPSLVKILPDAQVTSFGEMLGTQEAPKLIADYACALLEHDEAVTVALEIWGKEQLLLDAYLHSDGKKDAQAQLLSGNFWSIPDGRAGDAMLNLVEHVRRLKSAGKDVMLLAVDEVLDGDRDAGMAANINRHVAEHPKRKVIFLAGNMHAMNKQVHDGLPRPASSHIESRSKRSILISYKTPGSAWFCTSGLPSCGVHNYGSKVRDVTLGYSEADIPDGYDGVYYVERYTPSMPVKHQANP